jgi:hypothetical protein
MTRKMITLFCVLSLLAVFPGRASRAAAPAVDQPPQPDSASLSLPGGPGILSIPVSAFQPQLPEFDYENHGRYLKFFGPNSPYVAFNAAVPLPYGAIITRIDFTLYDDSTTKSATARLKCYKLGESPITLASYTSPGSSGWYQSYVSTEMIFDNYNYVYWVELELPVISSVDTVGDRVWGGDINIHYTQRELPIDSILSIAGSTFSHFQDGYIYNAQDAGLISLGGTFLAHVQLPQGAEVTKLSLLYRDNESDHTITATLRRSDTLTYSNMATVSSQDSETETRRSTTSISNATIDNATYTYWILLEFPTIGSSDNVFVYGVAIDYDPPASSSLSVVSLSTAAFTGFFDGFDYQNYGRWLFNLAGNNVYLAPVYLPNGSVVSSVQFGFYDGSTTENGEAYLVATRLGTNYAMASTTTSGNPGHIVKTVSGNDIDYEKIDNDVYAYFVYYVLPPSDGEPLGSGDVVATKVRIYYRPPGYAYLPLAMK